MRIELYRISIGAERFLYTTAQQEVNHNGETYVPTFVRRSRLSATESLARSKLSVEIPRDEALVTRFAPTPPGNEAEIDIFQRDDAGNTAVIYLGRVVTVSRKGSLGKLSCEPIYTSLKTAGLRRYYQKLCPYALYGEECGVDRANFRVDATLSAVSGVSLSAAAFDAKPDGWFTGGYVEWGDPLEQRAIVAHSGDTITLVAPLPDAEAGEDVVAFAGCDHTFATCGDKFDNAVNHGGLPFIPLKNPFGPDPVF